MDLLAVYFIFKYMTLGQDPALSQHCLARNSFLPHFVTLRKDKCWQFCHKLRKVSCYCVVQSIRSPTSVRPDPTTRPCGIQIHPLETIKGGIQRCDEKKSLVNHALIHALRRMPKFGGCSYSYICCIIDSVLQTSPFSGLTSRMHQAWHLPPTCHCTLQKVPATEDNKVYMASAQARSSSCSLSNSPAQIKTLMSTEVSSEQSTVLSERPGINIVFKALRDHLPSAVGKNPSLTGNGSGLLQRQKLWIQLRTQRLEAARATKALEEVAVRTRT